MISEFFVTLGAQIAAWFVGLFPQWEAPPELHNFDQTINDFVAPYGGLSVWAPWPLLIFCVVTAVAVWVLGLGIKFVRAVAAHLPFIGGAG